jgi:hypothetical protein
MLGIALAFFAACHVAAAYKMDARAGLQATETISLQRD